MRTASARLLLVALVSAVGSGGCKLLGLGDAGTKAKVDGPKAITIRSFSEASPVTAVQPSGNTLWVGTPRGLLKWDIAKATYVAVGTKDGLPGEKIGALAVDGKGALWVSTPSGVAHEAGGRFQSLPPHPVGAFVSGFVVTNDGALWAGGPEGLARLAAGRWTRYLSSDLQVTALVAAGDDVWVGTSGKGVLRVRGEQVEAYGPEQGCDTDVVRGLAATPSGVMAIGDGPGGPRMAFFDGGRFFSYKIEGGKGVLEWIRRVGNHVLIGAGTQAFSIERLGADAKPPGGTLRMVALEKKSARPPFVGGAHGELPSAPAAPAAAAAPPPPGKPAKEASGGKGAKPAVEESGPGPAWAVVPWGQELPEGVVTVGTDGLSFYVGTRFLGASRVGESDLTHFRTYDLARDAERLSVACASVSDCWVATGTQLAWHFDGQSFGGVSIDPERGSRVLAILEPPRGSVMAIHRGAADSTLRFSSVSREGQWTPTALSELQVPTGVPDVTFAVFAPNKHLWLGLRYIDKDGDKVDFGAAEVDLDAGSVVYHRQSKSLGPKSRALPNDMESAYFVSADEAWFGTRSGAVHVTGPKLATYTENDGLESEIIHDVLEGPDRKIWVATSRGVGRFDGARWAFPKEGDPLRVKAVALAKDRFGSVFVGAREGLVLCQPAKSGEGLHTERLDSARGLLDNSVLDLAVDQRGRVWVLTERGISVVDR